MHLAVINEETNKVENIIVPPEGAQAFFLGKGYYAVETAIGQIGDIYNPETREFINPNPPVEENQEELGADMPQPSEAKQSPRVKKQ